MLASLTATCGCAGFRLPAIDPSGRGIFLPNPNFTTLAGDGPIRRWLRGHRGLAPADTLGQPGIANPFGQHRNQLGQLFRGNNCFLLRGLHNHGGGLLGPFNQLGASPTNQPRCFLLDGGCGLVRGVGNGIHSLGRGVLGMGRGLHNSLHAGRNRLGARSGFASPWDRPTNGAFATPNIPPQCGADGLPPAGSPCYPMGSPTASSLAATLPGSASRVGSGLDWRGNATRGCAELPVDRQLTGASLLNTPTCGTSVQASSSASGANRFRPGVVITRPRVTARVGDEVVLIGGMQTSTGIAQPNEIMQWALSKDSVGTFLDTAVPRPRRSLFRIFEKGSSTASPTCGTCVKSVTASQCLHLNRNSLDPRDDIYLSRGQTWVSLTSASPGVSYVTLSAPQACGQRFANAIVEWVGPDQAYDPGAVGDYDQSSQFGTGQSEPSRVTPDRDTAQIRPPDLGDSGLQPLPGSLGDGQSTTPSPVPLGQSGLDSGSNGGVAQSLPRQGPELSVEVRSGSPAQIQVGTPVTYYIEVRNNSSRYPAQDVILSVPRSDTLRIGRSEPAGEPRAQEVVWGLGDIEPGGRRQVAAQFLRLVPGSFPFAARVTTPDGVNDSQPVTTTVAGSTVTITDQEPGLGPEFASAPANQPFRYFFKVRNRLPVPHPVNIRVGDWDEGIVPDEANPGDVLEKQVTIAANGEEVFPVQLRGVSPGTFGFRMVAEPQYGSAASTEGRVRIVEPRNNSTQSPPPGQTTSPIQIDLTGPGEVSAGQQEANYTISLRNLTSQQLSNVRLVVKFEQFELEQASKPIPQATQVPGEYFWVIGDLPPGPGLSKDIQLSVPSVVSIPMGRIFLRVLSAQTEKNQDYEIPIRENRNRPLSQATGQSVRTMRPVAEQRRAAFDAKKGLQLQIGSNELVRTNEAIDYEIVVRNDNEHSFRNLQLSVRVDQGVKYVELGAPYGTRSNISQDGRLIEFSTIRELMPNERLLFRVRAKSGRRGDIRFAGQLMATGLTEPITAQRVLRVN